MANMFKQELDLEIVAKEIDLIYARKGIVPLFVVMSEETQERIIESTFLISDGKSRAENKKTGYSCIFGLPIATCNVLRFGDFEVVG